MADRYGARFNQLLICSGMSLAQPPGFNCRELTGLPPADWDSS